MASELPYCLLQEAEGGRMRPLEQVRINCVGPKSEFADIRDALEDWGCDTKVLETVEDLRNALRISVPDLILLWLFPKTRDLLEAFSVAAELGGEVPIVVLTDSMNMDLYVEALKRGAVDAVGVPLKLNKPELLRITQCAAQEHLHRSVAKAA